MFAGDDELPENLLSGFDFQPRTRLVFGADSVDRAGVLAREIGLQRILLVTDPGIVAAGHAGRVQRNLEAAGLSVTLFDRARENPTTKCVDDCVELARAARVDSLIGLGGGSSMDTAKGCNFILTNGGVMSDYWGVGKATKPMLPFIAIPTTAGTGSELQSAALIAAEDTHQKMACLDPKCAAQIAILDPVLTVSQPPGVTACTGVDAIAHAIETAVTTKRNPLSQMFSHQAFKLCVTAFPEVILTPENLEARGRMQLGAALAGAAIEQSMLGAAHAAANPLTAHFGIIHGHAVGLMLPHVIQFNARDTSARAGYKELAVAAGLISASESPAHAAALVLARLNAVLDLAGMARSLAECNVPAGAITQLAGEAERQWTAQFNPRQMSQSDFGELYRAALNGAPPSHHAHAAKAAAGQNS